MAIDWKTIKDNNDILCGIVAQAGVIQNIQADRIRYAADDSAKGYIDTIISKGELKSEKMAANGKIREFVWLGMRWLVYELNMGTSWWLGGRKEILISDVGSINGLFALI